LLDFEFRANKSRKETEAQFCLFDPKKKIKKKQQKNRSKQKKVRSPLGNSHVLY